MGNKDKDKGEGGSTATKEARNACQASRDLSHERDVAISRQIAEAVTRETAKVTTQFQALLNEKNMLSLAGSLEITSRVLVFKL